MTCKQDIYDALDECGIPWDEPDFAPLRPPEPPYAVVRDATQTDGSDQHVMMRWHELRVVVCDFKDGAARDALSWALAARDVAHRCNEPDYNYDLKLFETEFEGIEFWEKKE